MIRTNTNYLQLSHRYLFAEIAQQVNAYKAEHPEADIIRLGIGDVTRPLPPAAIKAMHRAVDECADGKTFRGYGPEHGYDFLIDAIIAHDFTPRGIQLDGEEVFISDGAKSDTGNIGDILSTDNIVGITDPVYPVYVDTNIMAGRTINYIPCHADNGFTGLTRHSSAAMTFPTPSTRLREQRSVPSSSAVSRRQQDSQVFVAVTPSSPRN